MKKLVIVTLVMAVLAACGPGKRKVDSAAHDTDGSREKVEIVVEESAKEAQLEEVPVLEEMVAEAPVPEGTKVKISTSFGDMIAILYDETPKHRDNFIKLTKNGFYNDLLFHRVINQFMIQGGDPQSRGAAANAQLGSGGPGYTLPAEFNSKFFHKKGALSAARQGDNQNPERRSSGSQFYIVQGQVFPSFSQREMAKYKAYTTIGGTPHLDGQYTVFGEIIEGLEIIDKIASVPTVSGDRPAKDVKMRVTLVK